jgi:hypothetical protein
VKALDGTADRLVMSPADSSEVFYNDAVLRITNTAAPGLPGPQGVGVLRINSIEVADPTLFQIVSPADVTDVTLVPGATLDVTVRFIGDNPLSTGTLDSALVIRTNDRDEGVLSIELAGLPDRGDFVTGVNYGGGAIAMDPVLGVPLKAPTIANGVFMSTTRAPGTDSTANANGANATPGSAFKTYQDAPNWTTTIDVPNGTYIVAIHTQETYWNLPGKRIFDITVNGDLVADDLDPFVAAGNRGDTPVLIETLVTVTDGKVTILLDALAPDGLDNAAINAVTIYKAVATTSAGVAMTVAPDTGAVALQADSTASSLDEAQYLSSKSRYTAAAPVDDQGAADGAADIAQLEEALASFWMKDPTTPTSDLALFSATEPYPTENFVESWLNMQMQLQPEAGLIV